MADSEKLLDPIEVPVAVDVPLYTMRVVLDEREYEIRMDWNGREGRWYLGINTVEGRSLYHGVKVVADWPLLRRLVDPEAPRGMLVARDFAGSGEPPGFGDLGRRVRLLYFPIQVEATDVRIRRARLVFYRPDRGLVNVSAPAPQAVAL
jgi:hypothetical protein